MHILTVLCTFLPLLAHPLSASAQQRNHAEQRTEAAVNEGRSTLERLRRLADTNSNNLHLRLQYADALYEAGRFRDAAGGYDTYLQHTRGTPDILQRYLISIAGYEGDNERGERVAAQYLAFYPTNADLHMRLGYFRLWQGDYAGSVQAFEQSLRLDPNDVEAQRGLQQARVRQRDAERAARRASSQQPDYPIDRLSRELETRPTTEKRFRLVGLLLEAGRYFEAHEHLMRLAARHDTSATWLGLFARADRGLIRATGSSPMYVIDRLVYLHRADPADVSLRYRLIDALLEAGRAAEASDVLDARPALESRDERYRSRLRAIEDARAQTISRRIAELEAHLQSSELVEAASGADVSHNRPYRGLGYAGIIAPVAAATLARGSGTTYGRWSQGLMTQITLPVSAVVTAGITSHFLSGTRRLIPDSEIVRGRVNQVYAGAYADLTPPIKSARASYTNRLTAMGGVFDYEGSRTAIFGEFRYWRQEPGVYTGSVGVRSTEGSLELWSPAGGEFGLRLSQIDFRGGTAGILPDSVLRVSGILAFNLITDNLGSANTAAGANKAASLQIDAGYRVIPFAYAGLSYYHLSYRNAVDLYFSPRNYQVYTAWLEYEHEYGDRWYLRLRGSLGAVAQSNAFLARRIESDVIYRLARKFSVSASSSIGQSTRAFGGDEPVMDDQYNIFIFSGSLYWTL